MAVSRTFEQLDPKKKKRILSAAITEFATEGYAGASMNVLVEKLGIAKGSIFSYFQDKHGLFMFVFEQALEQVKRYLRRVRDETTSDDLFTRLEKTLLAGVSFIRAHPYIFRIYLRVLFEGDLPNRNTLIGSIRQHSIGYLTEFVEVAKQRGEIRPDIDSTVAAFVIEAVLDRFLQGYCLEHLDTGMGLFGAGGDELERWASGVIAVLRDGLGGQSQR
ncbi:MAG: TetR/AcrR family transcriptional regulator [Thermodesulfobacteriota bacterium]